MLEQDPDESRPAKRPRVVEEAADSPNTYTVHDSTLWFVDGNIILVSADHKGFRVHQSVLALHSEFFSDMFALAHPEDPNDGLPVACTRLALADNAEDLEWFMEQFYKPSFLPGIPTPFTKLASLLRLGTKYLCRQLRSNVIKHLCMIYTRKDKIWSINLRLPEAPPLVLTEDSYKHGILAIQMARENDIPDILPIAFYYACTLQSDELCDCSDILSIEDERNLLSGRAKLQDAVYEEAWRWFKHQPPPFACFSGECRATRTEIIEHYAFDQNLALRLFLQEKRPHEEYSHTPDDDSPAGPEQVCKICWEAWATSENAGYDVVWRNLPSYFGLALETGG